MSWQYTPQDFILLPQLTASELVNGDKGETVSIPVSTDIGAGFNVPSPTVPIIPPFGFSFPTSSTGTMTDYAYRSYTSSQHLSDSNGITIADTSSGNDIDIKFTVTTPGIYIVMGSHTFRRSGTGLTSDTARIQLNSSIMYINGSTRDYVANNNLILMLGVSGILVLDEGDEVLYDNNPGVLTDDVVYYSASIIRISG